MLEEVFKLEMNEVTHVLLVLMGIFQITPTSKVRNRQRAIQSQECFKRMLYR